MIEDLIKDELGFCCIYAFFRKYKASTQIAFRLGVEVRTIRSYKQRFKEGEFKCMKCEKCLKGKLF